MLSRSNKKVSPEPEMRRGRDATAEDWREYDAFGPWVDPVRSQEEMPPGFRAAYGAHEKARFLLKVPVDADRLQLRPGMNLYRQIIAVYDDHISLLHLDAGNIVARSFAWDEIAALRSSVNLLVARWTLLLKNGEAVSLDYKAVSARRLDIVTDFIRDRLTTGPRRRGIEHQADPEAIPDLFYRGLCNAVRNAESAPIRVVHFEPRDRLCRDAHHRFRLSTGILVLDTRNDLVVADRGEPTRSIFHATYVSRLTHIPYARIGSFAVVPAPDKGKRRLHQLRLEIDRQNIVLHFLAAPDDVVSCLEDRGIARARG